MVPDDESIQMIWDDTRRKIENVLLESKKGIETFGDVWGLWSQGFIRSLHSLEARLVRIESLLLEEEQDEDEIETLRDAMGDAEAERIDRGHDDWGN